MLPSSSRAPYHLNRCRDNRCAEVVYVAPLRPLYDR